MVFILCEKQFLYLTTDADGDANMPWCRYRDFQMAKKNWYPTLFFSMIQDDEIYYVNDVKENSCVINSIVLNA